MYDDFEERQAGAARRLESSLNCRQTNSNPSLSSSNGLGRSVGIISTFVLDRIRGFGNVLGGKEAKLPQHAPQTVPGIQSPYNPPDPPAEMLYLLLCHSEGIYATKLLQLPIADLKSDNQLFRILLSHYKSMRGQFRSLVSFRTLTSIRFVRFEMYKKSQSVDICKTDDIPPADHMEYKYAPVPIDIIPPVGENQLMHFFHHPEHAEDEPVCLDRFPKKRRERFAVCNGRTTEIGWGLHLVEGWDSRKTWVVCFVLFGFGSSMWGILWAVFKKSIQDAFAVAGFAVALAVFTVGFTQSMAENMNR
jgi:hypothetical protein